MTMKLSLTYMLLTLHFRLLCLVYSQEFLNKEDIEKIQQIISDDEYKFYPKLPPSGTNATSPLVFGLIMSFGGNSDSSGAVPGVRVALDRINKDTKLLPGYSLHYALSDSQCHRAHAIRALFQQLPYSEPKRIALIGGGCSVASESTAEISQHFNMLQISCVTATPELSDREWIPNYYQFLPSMIDLAPAYLGIIKEFQWERVAIYVQDESLFTVTVEKIKELLKEEKVAYTIHIFYSKEGLSSLQLEPFSNPDERIYIIASYEPYARELLCEAYHRNITYPTHLLMTFQWYSTEWWLEEDQNYTCTGEQRAEVLHHTLSVTNFDTSYLDRENLNTTMNITREMFLKEQSQHLGEPPFNFTKLEYSRYCHDATWALAWSLHKAIESVKLINLHTVDYRNATLTQIILQNLNNSFIGLSGNIEFNEYRVRRTNRIVVFQYRQRESGYLKGREIGRVIAKNSSYILQYSPNENATTLWPNGLQPYDGTTITIIDTVARPLAVVIYVLAVAGTIFSLVCCIFNFMYRKTRIMQISRPRLNYIIILGSILFYVGIIFTTAAYSSRNELLFHAFVSSATWTTVLGFSFTSGTIIIKLYRVHYIVKKPLPKRNIKDGTMVFGVVVLAIIDFVLLILNEILIVFGSSPTITLVSNRDNPHTNDGILQVSTDHKIFQYGGTSSPLTIIISVYKGLLQLIALILAFHTQNIKVKGLDNAKFIISTVYITTICIVVILLAGTTVRGYLNTFTAITTLALFFLTTVTLSMIFIPKMIGLYKDPKGEKVFDKYETPPFKFQQKQSQIDSITGTQTDSAPMKRTRELEAVTSKIQGNSTFDSAEGDDHHGSI